ncbi:Succinate dehydrogenase [Solidesulfovibrio fructosivorans JJ]]|uniref:Succinate dehydrogenase n=1 Tax=Solidesulfovibrio fructosivorans JJ] TaxID=596151 RepID=E1JVP5_SOLFR|nr:FAD-dependent oxidoreductase [Solidesulfovibrio fructosivorans]EFL51533.1 Succinate dehydrogenase [Solidesulfovibrio fructosivorans JJ]]
MAEEFDSHYDVIVIGGGGSGLSAAVQAAKNGLTCAVLEKEEQLGGSSAFAEGHAAFESDEQKKRGITVTKQEAYTAYIDYSHWRCDSALVNRFVENAATTITKMRDEVGAVYEDVTITAPEQPGELVTWHLPEGEVAHLLELLEADARRRGVDIFLSTPATRILRGEDGKIKGVVAKDADGETVRLGARAVVVGSGGYAANPALINKYGKFKIGEHVINAGGKGNTGDGLKMMQEVGAVENSNIGTMVFFPLMRDKTVTSHVNNAGMQPSLWVDKHGRRFTNETVGLNFGNAGDLMVGLPDAMFWCILDQDFIDRLVNKGNFVGLGIYVRNYEKLIHLPGELEADAANDSCTNVYKGETLEALAGKIGVAPEVLRSEVGEYNGYVSAGEDKKYRKDPKYLFPCNRGPFYAIKMEPGIMVSVGAIKINEYMQVLDANGGVIPGLYSVGCDAGGLFGESYQLTIPGSANGFALTSGWLSADDIAEKVNAGAL